MIGRLTILFFIVCGCQTPIKNGIKATKDVSTASQEESHGVCRMLQNHRNSFKLYNPDSTLYKEYIFDKRISKNKELRPFSMRYDYEVLVFTCYGTVDSYYKIKLNADDHDFKLIKKNDGFFVYEPWEKHILTVFAVEFDKASYPLQERNSETSKKMPYQSDAEFLPVKV